MPRFEKTGRGKEYFTEVVLEETRVYLAQGEREVGATEWRMKDSDRRTYGFRWEPEKAEPFYKEKLAELEGKGYKRASEETPLVAEMQAKRLKDMGPPDPEGEARVAAFEAALDKGPVRWVGKKPSNADQFMEVSVDGATMIKRQGKVGAKGKSEKEACTNHRHALNSGAISLNIARNFGWGPAE